MQASQVGQNESVDAVPVKRQNRKFVMLSLDGPCEQTFYDDGRDSSGSSMPGRQNIERMLSMFDDKGRARWVIAKDPGGGDPDFDRVFRNHDGSMREVGESWLEERARRCNLPSPAAAAAAVQHEELKKASAKK